MPQRVQAVVMIPPANGLRPPPRAVRLLLPVWGYRYVRQFLEFSLPTMLAAGNVPALAKALPCTFVLLTSADDAKRIPVRAADFKPIANMSPHPVGWAACCDGLPIVNDR